MIRKLKEYRQAYGYTQEKVAEFCEVSRQAVAKWENGTSVPDIEKLVRLSELFNTSLDMLIKGKDTVPQTEPRVANNIRDEYAKLINKGLQQAIKCDDPHEEIQTFISYIGQMMRCDRVYIFEQDPRGDYCNSYEWCNKGVSPQIHELQGIPESDIASWLDAFHEGSYVFIEDLKEVAMTDPGVYTWLAPQQIHALLVFPLFGGKGFFGVDNPVSAFVGQTATMLELVVHFVEGMLQRRDLVHNLLVETDQNRELDRVVHRVPYYVNVPTGRISINMDPLKKLGYHFELHSIEELKLLLEDHPECRYHILDEGFRKVERTKKAITIEFVFYSHDHTIHWVRLSIRPFMDSQGNLLRLYGNLQDISDEHQIIERYNMFTTHLGGGMHICYLSDPCHLAYASDNLCSLVGYTREQFDTLIGDSYDSLIVDEDYAAFKGFVRRLAENPGTVETCEYGLKHLDGSVVRVIDTMESVLDGNGVVYGYANVMDVSELHCMLDLSKKNEIAKIAELNKQYEIVEALSRDYRNVFLVNLGDGQAVIHKLNGYVTRGMDRESIEPISYSDFCRQYIHDRVYPDDQEKMYKAMHLETIGEMLQKQDEYTSSYRILEDGNVRYCQFKYIILNREEADNGQPVEVIAAFKIIPRTVQQNIEQIAEMEKERDRAEQASQAKSMFLARMSHDIRTPINTMLGMNEMIMRETDSGKIKSYATDIANSGNILLSLIEDILDLTKLDSCTYELQEQEYDLTALLADSYLSLRVKGDEKGLHTENQIDGKLPARLIGDDLRIKEVLLNLISNAIKYTMSGSITLSASLLKHMPEEQKVLIRFSVKDTGIGIASENQEIIFNAFERLGERENPKIQGSGLGLNISKKILSMMGSEIKVRSEVGKGSEFWFDLEQKVASGEQIIGNGKQEEEKTDLSSDYVNEDAKILIVDDTNLNLRVFKALLGSTHAHVDTAVSGMECTNMVQKMKYDLIFMDSMMPEMDGVQTLQWIRQQPNLCTDTPVVVLTADAVVGAKEEYLSKGFDDYLAKPVSGKMLTELVAKYIPVRTPMIDQDAGIHYCSGDPQLYREVLKDFSEDCIEKKERLKRDMEEEAWNDYRIAAHSLKGNAKLVGAIAFADHAEKHEKAARSLDFAYIREDFAVLCGEIDALVEFICRGQCL